MKKESVFVSALGEKIFRVSNQEKPAGSALNRYGFIKEPEKAKAPPKGFKLETFLPGVSVTEEGAVSFNARKGEDWIGFGDVTRERMFHRGHKIDCWVRNVKSYIPVPFFISTEGYAVLVNSTHRVKFDMCASKPDRTAWLDCGEKVDFYLFTGKTFVENIGLYTRLTGKPSLPPEWAFGLWYICREQANDYEAVNDALNFRREEIPCDVIGLEPGWMEKKYDLSIDKKWNPNLFPIPKWCPNGPHNFVNAIKRMGFHFELWECNEYDLSYEEERRLGAKAAEKAEKTGNFHEGAEFDEHFDWPRLADTVTKKDEPWFEHHKKFIDQGADFFKQDGSYQMCDHPDRVWGNGMLDKEMHNLYPLLYARQMRDGLKDHTKQRPVVFTVAGWAGFQSYAGTWTGDVGGRLETLGSMLNTSVMSHNWCTNDMEVMQPEGVHFGYLQPWSQINSWTYFRMPWIQGSKLADMHRFYSRLRARLIPYIYSWAYQSSEQGLPLLMRALQIEFEKDPECRGVMHEYLLGRDLLVSIYKNEVYFPEGEWKDFWTGKVYKGGKIYKISPPEGRGGGLFVRSGAIIPFGPLMQYRKEKALDAMELYIFPGKKESSFELFEDDGVTFDYQNGALSKTLISVSRAGKVISVNIPKPEGKMAPETKRSWKITAALEKAPSKVTVDGKNHSAFEWDAARGELTVSCPPRVRGVEITL
jgi:alpha-glucosidase (family GH31 glycosyl hydrolase)